jgi:hypothetical protein
MLSCSVSINQGVLYFFLKGFEEIFELLFFTEAEKN